VLTSFLCFILVIFNLSLPKIKNKNGAWANYSLFLPSLSTISSRSMPCSSNSFLFLLLGFRLPFVSTLFLLFDQIKQKMEMVVAWIKSVYKTEQFLRLFVVDVDGTI